jgi:hypothetical protein
MVVGNSVCCSAFNSLKRVAFVTSTSSSSTFVFYSWFYYGRNNNNNNNNNTTYGTTYSTVINNALFHVNIGRTTVMRIQKYSSTVRSIVL